MNSIVINYSKGKHGVLSDCTEGYSAVARGIDRKHIICKVSASALFRWNHDSIGPVPVKSGDQSNPQGLTAWRTRSRFEVEVWGGALTGGARPLSLARKRKTP